MSERGQWKLGDVVYLKSGSKAMTVCETANHSTRCEWMKDDGTIESWWFHPAMLTDVPPDRWHQGTLPPEDG